MLLKTVFFCFTSCYMKSGFLLRDQEKKPVINLNSKNSGAPTFLQSTKPQNYILLTYIPNSQDWKQQFNALTYPKALNKTLLGSPKQHFKGN